MTAPMRPKIRLQQPGELLAALPYLLGFRPHNSLVLVLHNGIERKTLGMVLRADLPTRRHYREFTQAMLRPVVGNRATGVSVIVVGGCTSRMAKPPSALPHRRLIEVMSSALAEHDVPVLHALWAPSTDRNVPWHCYTDPSCRGAVADAANTAIIAATTAAGIVTYASREELAEALAFTDPEAIRRRAELLDRASERAGQDPGLSQEESLATVTDAINAMRTNSFTVTDETVTRLALALSDHLVRDACLMPPDADDAATAETLWTELTRQTPTPERAEPACLLAMAAYLRGDGALAGMALQLARDADPGHQLASLLGCALQSGLPPGRLTEMVRGASERARSLLDGGRQ